ncbi:19117_t:CDS:2 [Racocetra fulgida]|uniref:19117_t:CDS:1 n=1 Tax=Racocetra fulgida TaxID=60492 RepID=A0A9N9AX27_9GLOM|nr:19117_t:CDS:2 [Racocetra fulgida]
MEIEKQVAIAKLISRVKLKKPELEKYVVSSPSKTNYQKYLTEAEINEFINALQAEAKEEKKPRKFKLDWFSNRLW